MERKIAKKWKHTITKYKQKSRWNVQGHLKLAMKELSNKKAKKVTKYFVIFDIKIGG